MVWHILKSCSIYWKKSCSLTFLGYYAVLDLVWIHISDVLRDLVPFVQFKNVKNSHGGVLLLLKLQIIKVSNEDTRTTLAQCITYIHIYNTSGEFFLWKDQWLENLKLHHDNHLLQGRMLEPITNFHENLLNSL